jgi:hypothetical protein
VQLPLLRLCPRALCAVFFLKKHTDVHSTPMRIFERLSRLDLEIYKVDHQERLTVDGDVASY